ncbi:TIGR00269 family protein [Candidatus Woesearchaeota archaeon CG10_big_fil_rev_8_21_14_0_10_36_11]|nr:MAG: TIGR00269 family protein [Candidatus Woesearchaeota archaeon CG10_big_fil_rev_8_21_14_0_10_36_11]
MGCTEKSINVNKSTINSVGCIICTKKSVIHLQHGSLCKVHFIRYFEDKVFKTINKYRLIQRDDIICVAASGGKDSTAALYLTKKYFEKYKLPGKKFFALLIDEGIALHRDDSLRNLETFCQEENIPLEIVNVKDNFNVTIDASAPQLRKLGKKPCTVCGIWRRYLLNKHARKRGATKLITGHNLDDEAQSTLMNIFKANTTLTANLGPISGVQSHPQFVQRIKPLFFCTNEEVEMYTQLKRWKVDYCDCIYAEEGYRSHVKKMLNEFETKFPGTKQGIIKSYLELLPLAQENLVKGKRRGEIKLCAECGEPANKDVCNACTILKSLKNV